MCGIVGYVGRRSVQELLLAGLSKLEYRGYDSAGISVIADERIDAVRAVGNLSALRAKLEGRSSASAGQAVAVAEQPATTGIGHTRWATHGRVSEENAHPHYDSQDRVHVVVNGIVENYVALKERLTAAGSVFTSETDAEVFAHLVADHYEGDLADAVRCAYAELEGHYAFVAMSLDEPEVLVGELAGVGRLPGQVEAAGVAERVLFLEVPPCPARPGRGRRLVCVHHLRRGDHGIGTGLAGHRDAVLGLGAHHAPHAHSESLAGRGRCAAASSPARRSFAT